MALPAVAIMDAAAWSAGSGSGSLRTTCWSWDERAHEDRASRPLSAIRRKSTNRGDRLLRALTPPIPCPCPPSLLHRKVTRSRGKDKWRSSPSPEQGDRGRSGGTGRRAWSSPLNRCPGDCLQFPSMRPAIVSSELLTPLYRWLAVRGSLARAERDVLRAVSIVMSQS